MRAGGSIEILPSTRTLSSGIVKPVWVRNFVINVLMRNVRGTRSEYNKEAVATVQKQGKTS